MKYRYVHMEDLSVLSELRGSRTKDPCLLFVIIISEPPAVLCSAAPNGGFHTSSNLQDERFIQWAYAWCIFVCGVSSRTVSYFYFAVIGPSQRITALIPYLVSPSPTVMSSYRELNSPIRASEISFLLWMSRLRWLRFGSNSSGRSQSKWDPTARCTPVWRDSVSHLPWEGLRVCQEELGNEDFPLWIRQEQIRAGWAIGRMAWF